MSTNFVYLVFQVMPFDDFYHEFEGAFSTLELAEKHKQHLIALEFEKSSHFDPQDIYVYKASLDPTQSN